MADHDSVSSPHLEVMDCTVPPFLERTWKDWREHVLKMFYLPSYLKGNGHN